MTQLNRSAACLRFAGENLDPDEITRLLGKTPTAFERKGQVIGGRVQRISKGGGWRLEAKDAFPANLDTQIESILLGATADLAIWQRLSRDYHGDIFCGLFLRERGEGLSISSQTMLSLGERGLMLDLDIYSGDSDP